MTNFPATVRSGAVWNRLQLLLFFALHWRCAVLTSLPADRIIESALAGAFQRALERPLRPTDAEAAAASILRTVKPAPDDNLRVGMST